MTIEDVSGRTAKPHPVQEALLGHHASQCGFCTPGMVMALFTLFHSDVTVDRHRAAAWLTGNLCRCTGYRPIIDAAVSACSAAPPRRDGFANAARRTLRQLAAIADDQISWWATTAASLPPPRALIALPPWSTATMTPFWSPAPAMCCTRPRATMALSPRSSISGAFRNCAEITETAAAFTVGAGVPIAALEPAMAAIDPDLGALCRRFGAGQVRAVATLGGNLASADPACDLPPALMALGAMLELRHDGRLRRLPIEEYFLGPGRQDRSRGEFITEVTVPKLATDQLFRCYKVTKRYDNDRAILVGAFRFTLERGVIAALRIAFAGLARGAQTSPRCRAEPARPQPRRTRPVGRRHRHAQRGFRPAER